MNQIDVNDRSGGLSEVSRKKLAKEVITSEQNLSSLIKRLVHPHIHPELLESGGVFTVLGLEFLRELFSLKSSDGEALGVIRKRFILQSATSDRFQKLYKSWVPTVDFTIEVPQPDTGLETAITQYRKGTIQQIETLPVPQFEIPTQVLGNALYQMMYRKFRFEASQQVAAAMSDAVADTIQDAESSIAFQMGQP